VLEPQITQEESEKSLIRWSKTLAKTYHLTYLYNREKGKTPQKDYKMKKSDLIKKYENEINYLGGLVKSSEDYSFKQNMLATIYTYEQVIRDLKSLEN
jgi:hypothetical protein